MNKRLFAQALTRIQDFYGAEEEYKEAADAFEKIQIPAGERDDLKVMMAPSYLNCGKPEKSKNLYLHPVVATTQHTQFSRDPK